jgi:hypothetical protein
MQCPVELHSRPNVSTLQSGVFNLDNDCCFVFCVVLLTDTWFYIVTNLLKFFIPAHFCAKFSRVEARPEILHRYNIVQPQYSKMPKSTYTEQYPGKFGCS